MRSFLAVNDLKLHVIAFSQTLVAFTCDAGIVDEHIRSVIAADESVPLGIIEPLNFSS